MFNLIKKEIIEGIRNYKFLIILIGILFFAIADPLMLKILPNILESQMPGLDITDIMAIDQPNAALNYQNSLYQIGTLIIGFTLMSLIAGELSNKTTIIPWCNGMNFTSWVLAKFIVYSLFIILVSISGTMINFLYSASLYSGRNIVFLAAVKAGALIGMFYVFQLACLLLLGSILKKPSLAGLITIATAFVVPALGSLFKVSQYTPGGLLNEAKLLIPYLTTEGMISIICTLGITAIFLIACIERLNKMELV